MIKNASGNLLTAPAQALVNTVNTEGVMGKGIALQFKHAFPDMYQVYADACKHGKVKLGKMNVYDLGGIGEGPRWIINFPTKGHWRSRSKLEDVEAGLQDLVATVRTLGIESVAVPPLGCGNGGLSWNDVKPLIVEAFESLPEVQVQVFEPAGVPPALEMPNRSAKPKLSVGSATLLVLMHRYLKGLMVPYLSQLEAQKLMYFLQEAGQPLKLNFKPHIYGPYAANLGHVLKRLDSHYLTGVGDGSSSPEKMLEPLPDGVEEAEDLLARDDETNKRIDRVTRLIAGFEDPYGMEMLSTMLWVMVHDAEARKSSAVAIERVHAWSPRKRKILKAPHLEKAWEHLKREEWDFTAQSIA